MVGVSTSQLFFTDAVPFLNPYDVDTFKRFDAVHGMRLQARKHEQRAVCAAYLEVGYFVEMPQTQLRHFVFQQAVYGIAHRFLNFAHA